jgi:hypothetical protein
MLMRPSRAKMQSAKRPAPPRAETLTLPAPIGGLNARDALASMPNTDAIKLDNWFPKPTSVDLRGGYIKYSTGYPAAVESLMTYNGPTVSKLFAASGTAFYDATAQGAVGAAVVSGLTNARWQHTNMGTPGGNFLVAVNGADYPEVFNGTLWASYATVGAQTISSITRVGTLATLTTAAPHGLITGNSVTVVGTTPAGFSGTFIVTVTGASTFTYVMAADPGGNATVVGTYTVFPAITGIDPRKFIHVNLYASRIFFVEKDSARVWYLPVNSIGGAALQLDFSSLLNLGGYIMAMATWTIDNAAGVNEYAVFISSEGEVLMYSGTDPAVAANWVKAGRFVIGRPVGRRCFMRVSSDVVLLTSDGFMPMSKAMLTDRAQQVALSDKITNLVSADLTNYQGNFGWQATHHPAGDKLIFNVPQIANSMQYQYVMNIISGAWCRFIGWNANVFATMADVLYFGSNLGSTANSAYVAKADFGFADDGGYVSAEAKTAFQFFGFRGYEKQLTMARPIFVAGGNVNAAIAMDMDFADSYPATTPTFSGNSGTPWNTAKWNTFPWSSGGNVKKDWQGVTGVGDAGALHMRVVNNKTATQWQSIQYVFKIGRIL